MKPPFFSNKGFKESLKNKTNPTGQRKIEISTKKTKLANAEKQPGELFIPIKGFVSLGETSKHETDTESQREIELRKKESSKTISEEERGELFGLRVFPGDNHAQELVKKDHLGLLAPKQKEELRRMRQLKTRRETMTPELQKLGERSEAHDPNVSQVSMNQGKSIAVSPEDNQEKVIWTYGLGGCFGVVVFSEDDVGNRVAILTHFDPTSIARNVSDLRRLIRSNPAMAASGGKQSVLVLGEELFTQNQQTKKWETTMGYPTHTELLASTIRSELGQDVDVKFETYSTSQSVFEKDYGTLIVRVPPTGQATYRTWFSHGLLGKSDISET